MPSRRISQINSLLQAEIAALLPQFFHEEKYGLLTVTSVQVAKGFDTAQVFVSCLKYGQQFLADAEHQV